MFFENSNNIDKPLTNLSRKIVKKHKSPIPKWKQVMNIDPPFKKKKEERKYLE